MPQCATQGAGGLVLQQMSSQADACTGVVLLEPADVAQSPFNLSPADGAAVAGAVGSVWIAAFAFKAIVRAVRETDQE